MIKKLFRWDKGRQRSGYDKMLLWHVNLLAGVTDGYLLRFPEGSKIPPHTDKVDHYHHYRLNIVVRHAKSGGDFVCPKAYINTSRVKFFKSDTMEHEVTEVTQGTRYLLSIGFAFKK